MENILYLVIGGLTLDPLTTITTMYPATAASKQIITEVTTEKDDISVKSTQSSSSKSY